MGMFRLLQGRSSKEPEKAEQPQEESSESDLYSNIRVEANTMEGDLLFVGKLKYPRGSTAELHQITEASIEESEDPIPVKLRGYNDREKKAVYLEGIIFPKAKHVWQVEQLTVTHIGNDRAFFRLDTNSKALVTKLTGTNAGERPCKLINISVGGARIASECEYWENDRLLLTVKLIEDREPSIMYCQVLRILEKGKDGYEYGCRFLELNEADEEKITQNIYALQRKMRGSST